MQVFDFILDVLQCVVLITMFTGMTAFFGAMYRDLKKNK